MDEPVISDMPAITLFGVSFWGDPYDIGPEWTEGNAIGRLWKRFFAMQASLPEEALPRDAESFEVHVMAPHDADRGYREVFVGRRVVPGYVYPVEFSVKAIPASSCARVTLRGREITDGWEWLYGTWLPNSGYRDRNWMAEVFDARFKGLAPGEIESSVIEVIMPVVPK